MVLALDRVCCSSSLAYAEESTLDHGLDCSRLITSWLRVVVILVALRASGCVWCMMVVVMRGHIIMLLYFLGGTYVQVPFFV